MGGGKTVIVAGIGCRRGCPADDIVALVRRAAALAAVTIDRLATPVSRLDAVSPAARLLGLPLSAVPPAGIVQAQPRCVTRSARVQALVGVAAVAEAAALACAGRESRLLLKRIAGPTATCALAEGP